MCIQFSLSLSLIYIITKLCFTTITLHASICNSVSTSYYYPRNIDPQNIYIEAIEAIEAIEEANETE